MDTLLPTGLTITAPVTPEYATILTAEALGFVAKLLRAFEPHRQRDDVEPAAAAMLDFRPEGPITEAGLRNNVQVGIQYVGSWLAGNGCVAIFNLMEDAATAEIARSQIWQWIRSPKGRLDDGRKITKDMFKSLLAEELARTRGLVGESAFEAGRFVEGARLFSEITTSDDFVEFLTLPAYQVIE